MESDYEYYCSNCNKEVPQDAKFCPHCQENLNDNNSKKSALLLQCPKCNNKVKEETKICPKCNTILFFEEKTDLTKRLDNIKQYNLGQKLLREREYLFEEIYREDDLGYKLKFFAGWSLIFSSIYGFCLGIYSGVPQMFVGMVKVPLLLFCTIIVCTPLLYTFNVLLGSKLSFKQIISMLIIKTYLMSTILVSFSLILALFIITGGTHDFITLLNVIMFGIAGLFGVTLLWNGMNYLTVKSGYTPNNQIIALWIIIYIFVSLQMAWTLRPFVGPKGSFDLFRQIGGNIYLYLIELVSQCRWS